MSGVSGVEGREAHGEVLLAHAERVWEAEREVAARLSERGRFLVTVANTLLAAVLAASFTALKLLELDGLPAWISAFLVVMTVLFASLVTKKMLDVPIFVLLSRRLPDEAIRAWREAAIQRLGAASQGQPARVRVASPVSAELPLTAEERERILNRGDQSLLSALVAARVEKAAERLRERNVREKHRIHSAEGALVWGIRWIFVLVLILTVTFSVQLIGRSVASDEHRHGTGHGTRDGTGSTGRGA